MIAGALVVAVCACLVGCGSGDWCTSGGLWFSLVFGGLCFPGWVI